MKNTSLQNRLIIIIIVLLAIYFAIPALLPSFQNKGPFFNNHLNLGLDLRGGSSLLLEIDTQKYFEDQTNIAAEEMIEVLRSEGVVVTLNKISEEGIELNLDMNNNKQNADIQSILVKRWRYYNFDIRNNKIIVMYDNTLTTQKMQDLIAQTMAIIRKRIDEYGTKEIDLQRQGVNKILLQVPGMENPEQLKKLLGSTAKLSLHKVVKMVNRMEMPELRTKTLPMVADGKNIAYFVINIEPVISGEHLIDAQLYRNIDRPAVSFTLNKIGSELFGNFTSKNKGQKLAIVLDNKVLSAPTINEAIFGGKGIITGDFTIESASNLALMLRAGALPAPIKVAEERIIGASLGSDSIKNGKMSIILAAVFVMIIMVSCYGFMGFIAIIGMVVNIILMIALMSIFGVTITLPSIAGIVLTMGMSVDANVLIFERMREERKSGKNIGLSIRSGYKYALITILDSNITTIIAAAILYIMASGSIRGFAVALIIGILCSMFSAVILTKMLIIDWFNIQKRYKIE